MLLFCIPHAGGSTLSYIKWKKYLDKQITFVPLDLPGHITRQKDRLCENFYQALEDLYDCLCTTICDVDEEYSIYGHSLGAVFAYELYALLKERGKRLPTCLFFSGRWPPYIHKKEDSTYRDYEEFKNSFVKKVNLDKLSEFNDGLGEYFYKVIYSDLKLLDTYQTKSTPYSITSDIAVMWGSDDQSMSYKDVSAWRSAAVRNINFMMISGAHLFPIENTEETVNLINRVLERY